MNQPKQTPFAIVPLEAAQDHRLTAMQYRVLIALLTFRNRNTDTCCPRRELIAERCGYNLNSVSRATAQLVELGWLTKTGAGGRSSPSHYKITVPETLSYPETVSDPDTKTLSDPDTQTLSDPERGKEQTNKQTRGQSARVNGHGRKELPCPEGVSPEVWADFLRHRKNLKAPLTATAWRRMAPELEAAAREGWDRDDALAEAMAAGWRGLKADWLRNRCQQQQQHNSPFQGAL